MPNWIIIYWFTTNTLAVLCMGALFAIYIRKKDPGLCDHLLVMLSFSVIVFSRLIAFYLEQQVVHSQWSAFLGSISYIGTAMLIYSLPRLANTFSRFQYGKISNWIWAVVALLLLCGVLLFHKDGWIIALFVALALSILYIVFFGLLKMRQSHKKKMMVTDIIFVFISFLLFPGFIVVDFFYDYLSFIHRWIPRGFYFVPVFYLFWNIVVLVKNLDGDKPVDIFPKIKAQKLSEQYGLSRREREVLPLLLQGKSYKEVAGILFISPATVKSHVIHIYQKIGVNNKTELLYHLRTYFS